MRILVVSPLLPYEQVPHAGGQFLLRHVQELVDEHDVRLCVPGAPAVCDELDRVPTWLPLTVTPFDRPRIPSAQDLAHWFRRRLRFRALRVLAVRGLRIGGFYELARDADLIELQWMDSAILGRSLRRADVRAPIVVVAHDVTALAEPAFRRLTSPARWNAVLLWLADRLRTKAEVADLNVADLILVFKQEDGEALARLGVRTPHHVIEPSLELPRARPRKRRDRQVLFTGAMWRPQNQHGVEWLLEEVWPTVASTIPEVELLIVGAGPPDWLVDLAHATPATTVTGTVEDMVPFYEEASVFVAPLFAPGGVKFKVPQAMVFDLPIVATPVAVEGLRAPKGTLWEVTADPSEMADALVRLLSDPAAGRDVGRVGGRWAREHYSFSESTRRVLDRYEQLIAASHDAAGEP